MAESTSTTPMVADTRTEAQPTSTNFIHPQTAANLSAWIQHPLPDVGSNTMPLSAYPIGTDHACRNASKKQILNTFSCLSLSHLVSLRLQSTPTLRTQPTVSTGTSTEDYDVLAPPISEIEKLTTSQINSYLAGELVYTRVNGFVTRMSLVKKLQRMNSEKLPTLTIDNVTAIAQSAFREPDSTTRRQTIYQQPIDQQPQSLASAPISGTEHQEPSDPITWEIAVPSLPIRQVTVSHLSTAEESPTTPYSPIYGAILSSFANDQGTAIRATLKSAAARDATTWSLIANSLHSEHGSCMDIAPMLRVALLAHSLSSESGINDPTPLKVIRNITTELRSVQYQARPLDPEFFKIIAMPLDTFAAFLALNSYYNTPPEPFTPTEVDRSWAAVPVSDQMAVSPFIHEYITMHLASDTTYGTVSYEYTVEGPESISGTLMTLPSSNLAYVSGPKNLILVMTDRVNATAPPVTLVGTMNIPTFSGRTNPYPSNVQPPPPITPFSFNQFWQGYYNTQRIFTIRANLFQCWDYMCRESATENTCGRALSLAAELIVSTPPGLFVHPKMGKIEYDLGRPLSGGIMLTTQPNTPTMPISDGSPYLLSTVRFVQDDQNTNQVKNIMAGVNLAKLSALHIPPSGLEKITVDHNEIQVYTDNRFPNPRHTIATYKTSQCSSLKRLAIQLKLIETARSHYTFSTADALAGWLHMLAHAMAANTSLFLQNNDIPTRDWSGYNSYWSDYQRFAEISQLKKNVLGSMVNHVEVEQHMLSWPNYDQQFFLSAYDGIDPFSDRRWLQQTVVPAHFHLQWYEKLQFGNPPATPTQMDLKLISVYSRKAQAYPMTTKNKQHIEYVMLSFNTAEYHPILIDRTPNDDQLNPVLGSWVDQIQYQSTAVATQNRAIPNRAYLETMAQSESVRVIYSAQCENRSLYVTQSDVLTLSWSRQTPSVTPITWPDPPSFMDIIKTAKNYAVNPALSALAGWMTGGPVAAAISGVASLISQGIEDLTQNAETEKMRKAILDEVHRHPNATLTRMVDSQLEDASDVPALDTSL